MVTHRISLSYKGFKKLKKRNSKVTINIKKRSLTWSHPAEVLTPSVLKLAKNKSKDKDKVNVLDLIPPSRGCDTLIVLIGTFTSYWLPANCQSSPYTPSPIPFIAISQMHWQQTYYMYVYQSHKVNRCLSRYSPRATTTNQPMNRAPNESARPGPKWTKMPISGQKILIFTGEIQKCIFWTKFGSFWAKNPNFYGSK